MSDLIAKGKSKEVYWGKEFMKWNLGSLYFMSYDLMHNFRLVSSYEVRAG